MNDVFMVSKGLEGAFDYDTIVEAAKPPVSSIRLTLGDEESGLSFIFLCEAFKWQPDLAFASKISFCVPVDKMHEFLTHKWQWGEYTLYIGNKPIIEKGCLKRTQYDVAAGEDYFIVTMVTLE